MRFHIRRIWIILFTVVLTGLPIWLTPYSELPYFRKYSVFILGICSLVFILITYCPWKDLLKMQVVSFLIAWAIKVVIDARTDPSNHNLLPLELFFVACLGLISASIGIALGLLVNFLRNRMLVDKT